MAASFSVVLLFADSCQILFFNYFTHTLSCIGTVDEQINLYKKNLILALIKPIIFIAMRVFKVYKLIRCIKSFSEGVVIHDNELK